MTVFNKIALGVHSNPSPSSPVKRPSPPSKSRPSVAEIFSLPAQKTSSPTAAPSPDNSNVDNSNSSLSFPNYIVSEGNSNLFDVSQQLGIPSFPPPGLEFDVNSPMFGSPPLNDSSNDNSQILAQEGGPNSYANNMTSTPYRPKDLKEKGKEKATEEIEEQEENKVAPEIIDETAFHSKENSPKFAQPLHERSQSFSFGQTVFYSMANSFGDVSKSTVDDSAEAAYPSSELKPESVLSSSTASSVPSVKGRRNRAMSDTVFQTILRSSSTTKPIEPEADINDAGRVVYSVHPPSQTRSARMPTHTTHHKP